MDTRNGFVRDYVRETPILSTATAVMYGGGAAMLGVGALTWSPGKNPRWVIIALALTSLVVAGAALLARQRFQRWHALVLVGIQVGAVVGLTANTEVDLAAVTNGAVLPIIAAFCTWFLHPLWGRVVLYTGMLAWVVVVIERGEHDLIGFTLSIAMQTVVTGEAFALIYRRVERLTRTDPLTGIPNRRDIIEHAELEFDRAQRRGYPFTLVMIDIDGLREVNNLRGHNAGDAMIRAVTTHWRHRLDRQHRIGRIGGDEFVLVLPGAHEAGARALVEHLAQDTPFPWSAGVATARPGEAIDSLTDRADKDMYAAKHSRLGEAGHPQPT